MTTSMRGLCALVAALALAAGCGEKSDGAPSAGSAAVATTNPTDPRWVEQSNPKAAVAVVFVHGLFGDTLGTWTSGTTSFFRYLKDSPVGQHVDVFAFGFTTQMLGSGSLNINEASNKLTESLRYHDVLDYHAIVFVAHSMGGLVVMRNLIANPEFAKKVPLVALFATPQEGAQISSIADKVAQNPGLAQMVPADKNGFLQQLNDDWRRLAVRPTVTCGYEKLPTYGVMIVPWSTATRFCDEAPTPIEGADHMTIAKPDRKEHGSVVLLVNAMNRHVIGKQFKASLEVPDFTKEGDAYVVTMESNLRDVRLHNPGKNNVSYTVSEVSSPSLYINPDDTPRVLGGEEKGKLTLLLLAGALKSEYRFRLMSDIPTDYHVIVRVPNVDAISRARAAQVEQVLSAMNNYLSDERNYFEVKKLAANDPTARDRLAKVAYDAVAVQSKDVASAANWLITADLLASANWPQLSMSALRAAEAVSAKTAVSPSAQALAGSVAAQAGEKKVFVNVPTPVVKRAAPSPSWLVPGAKTDDASLLATRLKGLDAYRALGYSLEGDLEEANGNRVAAMRAYSRAASYATSPSISARIADVRPSQFDKAATKREEKVNPRIVRP